MGGGSNKHTIAEGYIEFHKQKSATKIIGEASMENTQINAIQKTTLSTGVNITSCSKCVINIYN